MKEKTFVTLIDPPNGTQCSVLKIMTLRRIASKKECVTIFLSQNFVLYQGFPINWLKCGSPAPGSLWCVVAPPPMVPCGVW